MRAILLCLLAINPAFAGYNYEYTSWSEDDISPAQIKESEQIENRNLTNVYSFHARHEKDFCQQTFRMSPSDTRIFNKDSQYIFPEHSKALEVYVSHYHKMHEQAKKEKCHVYGSNGKELHQLFLLNPHV